MAVKYYNYPADKDKFLSSHFQMGEFVTYSDYYGNYPSSVPIDDGLPKTLEMVFDHFKCSKGIISSGYRTPSCDVSVGGSGSGPHTRGIAVDVCFYDKNGNPIPSRIISCFLQKKGIKGIGLHCGGTENWTHFDMRTESVWFGDENDYSCGYNDFFSYTGTKYEEVFPDGDDNVSNNKTNTNENSTNNGKLHLSDSVLNIIKTYEGLSLKACKAISSEQYYTIGYGHYGPEVGANDTITEKEAESLLRKDIEVFENAVSNAVKVGIAQNEFDALVCLAYNIGTGAIADSDSIKFLNKGQKGHACVDIASWRKAGGQILPGLEKRREKEMQIFGEGSDFTLTDNMNVRVNYGTNSAIKRVSQISDNGKKCVINDTLSANAVFKSGTEITALEIKAVYSSNKIEVWFRCPSGWICARSDNEIYVE